MQISNNAAKKIIEMAERALERELNSVQQRIENPVDSQNNPLSERAINANLWRLDQLQTIQTGFALLQDMTKSKS